MFCAKTWKKYVLMGTYPLNIYLDPINHKVEFMRYETIGKRIHRIDTDNDEPLPLVPIYK